MRSLTPLEPIDYLVIGHITKDLTSQGPRLGGTATYASLTASALGLRVGIVTSWAHDVPVDPLDGIQVANFDSDVTTTFENINTPVGRIQVVHQIAPRLEYYMIPDSWRSVPIVHLGPVAQEVDPGIVRYFGNSLIGLTPQGWLRAWDEAGHVYHTEWPEASFLLGQAGAAVLSLEDVDGSEQRIEEMATAARVLVVTEAGHGARSYWAGDVRSFSAPDVLEVDPTGAGDIFAAAFFTRLHTTRDPWEAARFATQLASYSVTRPGLEGIPTQDEIQESMVEVF